MASIGRAVQPLAITINDKLRQARDFSESKIGLGATAAAFGTVQFAAETLGVE